MCLTWMFMLLLLVLFFSAKTKADRGNTKKNSIETATSTTFTIFQFNKYYFAEICWHWINVFPCFACFFLCFSLFISSLLFFRRRKKPNNDGERKNMNDCLYSFSTQSHWRFVDSMARTTVVTVSVGVSSIRAHSFCDFIVWIINRNWMDEWMPFSWFSSKSSGQCERDILPVRWDKGQGASRQSFNKEQRGCLPSKQELIIIPFVFESLS